MAIDMKSEKPADAARTSPQPQSERSGKRVVEPAVPTGVPWEVEKGMIELAIQGCEKELRFLTWDPASCDWENVLRENRLPYETPLDPRFPLHFDSSVRFITCEDSVEEQAALNACADDFDDWKKENDISFDACLRFSYAIAARRRPSPDGRQPEPSPVFIRTDLDCPTEIEKIPLVHEKIKEIMGKHCQNVPGLNLVYRFSVTLPDEWDD